MKRWLWVLLAVATTEGECEGPSPEYAVQQARRWAQDMGYEQVLGVSCSAIDSDGDGYLSCALRLANGPPVALECRRSYGDGCKLVPGVR